MFVAPTSGAGKTTVAMGVAAILSQSMNVRCFKAGPDYIDPGFLTAGGSSRAVNLDSWLLTKAQLRSLFHRRASVADIAIVEGVMGLFDGKGMSLEGSSAELADWLKIPLVLVVDASGAGRSHAAVVSGFNSIDPRTRIAGVFLNRVGSPRHLKLVAQSIKRQTGLPVIGHLPRANQFKAPSRHLGLEPPASGGLERLRDAVADAMAETTDIDLMIKIAKGAGPVSFNDRPAAGSSVKEDRIAIGVAKDKAFSFYYDENLELLESFGAELKFFSPLRDQELPTGLKGLYFGGGWPELYAKRLNENRGIREEILAFGRAGLPVYAECGGQLYLSDSIEVETQTWPMVGLLPATSALTDRRQGLGYREAVFSRSTILGPRGTKVRGHEFHWSRLRRSGREPFDAAYLYKDGRQDGFASRNVLASYLHQNWLGQPLLADSFVQACRAGRDD